MNSALHLLGLARKGGNLALGEDAVADAVARALTAEMEEGNHE